MSRPGIFGAVDHRQTYSNVAYLLLGLPLGIFYFVFLVTGLSVGFGLLITLAGIPILLAASLDATTLRLEPVAKAAI